MRSPGHFLFFASAIHGAGLTLDAEESRHAAAVLHVRPGDPFQATDGRGNIYECVMGKTGKGESAAEITATRSIGRPATSVACFIGLPDRAAFEAAVEDVTALGVAAITPVICRFCQKPWWRPRWEDHAARLRKKMVAAIKQSLNAWLPVLNGPTEFRDALDMMGRGMLVADHNGRAAWECVPRETSPRVISCLVGPPGGFSQDEAAALGDRSAILVKLSPYRLRTELAAVLLCAAVLEQR